MIKYFCDDCGAELGRLDNIAIQLDMTGHTYCQVCLQKHVDEYKTVVYKCTGTDPFSENTVHVHIQDEGGLNA